MENERKHQCGKKQLVSWKYVSALFMDLLKPFDTINLSCLLLPKLKEYKFLLNALKLMHRYFKKQKQKV